MLVTLEGFTPYRQSALWRIHDAYYNLRGAAAWDAGEIPHRATTNQGYARQVADFLVEAIAARDAAGLGGPDGAVTLLEVGGGNGLFVVGLFEALAHDAGDAGRALLGRLRYVLTDLSPRTLAEAVRQPRLAALVAEGRVVPAVLDARTPAAPRALDGAPLGPAIAAARPDGVIANYVACVLPTTFVRKLPGGGWAELYVELRLSLPDDTFAPPATPDDLVAAWRSDPSMFGLREHSSLRYQWRPRALEEILPDSRHARVARRFLGGVERGSFTMPFGFLDLVDALGPRLAPGGFVLVSDYGAPEPIAEGGGRVWRPSLYGSSFNHAVDFPVFDSFGAEANWEVERTHHPLRSTHQALLAPRAPSTAALRRAFGRVFEARQDGQDLLDFLSAARALAGRKEHDRAARLFERAAALDPRNAGLRWELAAAMGLVGAHRLAIVELELCRGLDGASAFDIDLQLGCAWHALGEYERAIMLYEKSLEREQSATTWCQVAQALEQMGDLKASCQAVRVALDLEPRHQQSRTVEQRLRDRLWEAFSTRPDEEDEDDEDKDNGDTAGALRGEPEVAEAPAEPDKHPDQMR